MGSLFSCTCKSSVDGKWGNGLRKRGTRMGKWLWHQDPAAVCWENPPWNAVRVFDVLLQGLIWNAQMTALVLGRGISCSSVLLTALCQRIYSRGTGTAHPSWRIWKCLVQRITHPGKEDFPGFPRGMGVLVPQESRSGVLQPSFQTGEVRKGVKEPFGNRNTELEPEHVKQAEPRALELRSSTEWRLGKLQH